MNTRTVFKLHFRCFVFLLQTVWKSLFAAIWRKICAALPSIRHPSLFYCFGEKCIQQKQKEKPQFKAEINKLKRAYCPILRALYTEKKNKKTTETKLCYRTVRE